MTGLFSGGFAWSDDVVSQPAATPLATASGAVASPAKQDARRASDPAVASVAGVAETEGRRLERALSQTMSPVLATPGATAGTADFRGVEGGDDALVAGVASVAAWRTGVDRLRGMRHMPKPYHAESWRGLIDDATRFLDLWGEDAVRAGWSTLEAFGTNPEVWQRRCDRLGLVILLGGRPIQSLDSAGALIGTGADTNTYRRRPRSAGGVALWDVKMGVASG